ncbi:MAG: Xaa-Pro peptidase family protein, partial [Chlorobi bacterium]|nr:Xaa-Pro peptidase family protein [Chlorobiota bacterium]
MINIERVAELLNEFNLDGWLLYDFRGSNPILRRFLSLDQHTHTTRRFVLWIPRNSTPLLIVSSIEPHLFEHVSIPKAFYHSRHQWHESIATILKGVRRIAVEYSPLGQLPTVSYLDAGTAEFFRSFGVELVSSADLIQSAEAVWTADQIADNMQTARKLREIMMATIKHAHTLAEREASTEFDLQQFILAAFEQHNLVCDHPPIVAIGEHSANPHYEPHPDHSAPLRLQTVLLLDMWAKSSKPEATYADITWTLWLGNNPPDDIRTVAQTVFAARDNALQLVRNRFASNATVYGYEVDDASRSVIAAAGYGDHFIHRTGHSIGTDVHGLGANMDNYETIDTRRILAGTSFSIEPGIYIPGYFGIRSECDVVIEPSGNVLVPSEPLQTD